MRRLLILDTLLFLLLINTGYGKSNTDSIRGALLRTDDPAVKARLYLRLAESYQTRVHDSSRICLQEALNLATALEDDGLIGEVYVARGELSLSGNRLDDAERNFSSAMGYFLKAGDSMPLARMYLYLGNLWYLRGNLEKALTNYFDGMNISERQRYTRLAPHFYSNIGMIYTESEDLKSALDYLTRAVDQFRKNGDSANIGYPLVNIGVLYVEMNNLEVALGYFNRASVLFHQFDDVMGISQCHIKMGAVYRKQGKYPEAEAEFREGDRLLENNSSFRNQPMDVNLVELLQEKGINHFFMRDYPGAKTLLLRSHRLATRLKLHSFMILTADYLSRTYEILHVPDSAISYFRIFHTVSDSLSKAKSIRTIQLLSIQKEFEKRQKENDLKLLHANSSARKLRIIYFITGVILLAGIFILFLLLRIEKQKKHQVNLEKEALNEKLEFRNKEIVTNVMYLNRMNDQVLSISEKLRKFEVEEGSGNAATLRSIIRDLNQSSQTNPWKEFEVRFQQVHTDFYNRLAAQHPDLTPNELRLCAFLRLNMNTKEINSLTAQSENSINVARTRLRQKLNLPKYENLITYLARF